MKVFEIDLTDIGMNSTEGQFATFLLTSLSRSLLRDVNIEFGRGSDIVYLLEFEEITQFEGVGIHLTGKIFGVAINLELEVDVALLRIQQSPELFFSP